MRRVVITGIGMVTPLGSSPETVWANILASQSGAGPITRFDAADHACRIACEVKAGDGSGVTFDPTKRIDHKVLRQVDPFIVYGIDAAGQALEDAGLTDMTEEQRYRAGCMIGSGIGGLPGIEKESIVLHEKGPRRVSPHFVHGRLINLISGQVSIKYGLMGPNHAVVTACSTGAHAIGDAARLIALTTPTSCSQAGRKGRSVRSASPASRRHARCRPGSTTIQRARRDPTTSIATASSWAKVPASSASRSSSARRRAARRSMPR